MLEALAREGFLVESLTGTMLELSQGLDFPSWLAELGFAFEVCSAEPLSLDMCGLRCGVPAHYRLNVRGVGVTLYENAFPEPHAFRGPERDSFRRLVEVTFDRFRPEILVNYGGDVMAHEVRVLAKECGCAIVFALHNFGYESFEPFAMADAVIVPSHYAAAHYRKTLGLSCSVLPNLVDYERVKAPFQGPGYVTFVNPSHEKGVYAFARIADALGQRRPDIRLLVVEARGSEQTLADCGLDLCAHGNVSLMAHTHDPRRFWSVTRICLMPSLWWENQPLVALEAMVNGIPVIGTDRGGLPEALGNSGIVLPLPEHLTPFSRELPTVEQVAAWVEAIIRLWDDSDWHAELRRRALAESRRWDPVKLASRYVRFFNDVRAGSKLRAQVAQRRAAPASIATTRQPSRTCARGSIEPTIEAGIAVIKRRWPDIRNDCDEDPIFILSAGWRSGSTMLQRLIVDHCLVWGEPFGHAGMIDSLADHLRCFTEHWPESHHFHTGASAADLKKTFIANLYPSVQDLLTAHQGFFERLFAEPARRLGTARWGFKEVRLSVDHAIYLKWLYPRAKFLFLIRNPYDAWRSYASRAARGWKWFKRWPNEPLTVHSFAAHWQAMVTSFLNDHQKVDGRMVRYEELKLGAHEAIEEYLHIEVSRDAANCNPSDGGPPPLTELCEIDLAALDAEVGALAATLGYGYYSNRVEAARTRPGTQSEASPGETVSDSGGGVITVEVPAIGGSVGDSLDPAKCVILVPVAHHIEAACDDALRALERRGYTVRRVRGFSAIDQGRNQIATDALRDGFEELMWIDADVAFEADSVERLRSYGLPVTCGVYPKKGRRSFACNFPAETKQVLFGRIGGLLEIPYAGAGFLHSRREVYQSVREQLQLPDCNERLGPSMTPYFHPMVIPDGAGNWYLAEDYSFCYRARQCGYRIMADTAIRLMHIGSYSYGWEDAGADQMRYENYRFIIAGD